MGATVKHESNSELFGVEKKRALWATPLSSARLVPTPFESSKSRALLMRHLFGEQFAPKCKYAFYFGTNKEQFFWCILISFNAQHLHNNTNLKSHFLNRLPWNSPPAKKTSC